MKLHLLRLLFLTGLMLLVNFAKADINSDAQDVMNTHEALFKNFFPSHQSAVIAGDWLYRYYPETKIYQGFNKQDGNFYLLGPNFSDQPLSIAALEHIKSQLSNLLDLKIFTESGDPLPSASSNKPKLIAGKKYRVQGFLPEYISGQLSGDYVVLETKAADSTTWNEHKTILIDGKGINFFFTVPSHLRGDHEFRLRLSPKNAGSATSGTSEATPITGAALGATVSYEVSIQITNDTKDDLIFYVPLGGSISGSADSNDNIVSSTASGNLTSTPLRLNQGQTGTLTYTNPNFTGFGWLVNRVKCLGSCDNYVVNWGHTPNNNYTSCADQMPKLTSNQTTYVRVTPRTLSSSMDLFIWGDVDPQCTAGLDNAWGNFWDNHPKLTRFAEVAVATAAAVGVVSLIVLTFPEGEVGGLVLEGESSGILVPFFDPEVFYGFDIITEVDIAAVPVP